MSLTDSKVLYVFLDVTDLDRQRWYCEQLLGLPVIEAESHPPHEYHGLVKYDAGGLILSLNLAGPRRFDDRERSALTLAIDAPGTVGAALARNGYAPPTSAQTSFADRDGHRYRMRLRVPGDPSTTAVTGVRLLVPDLEEASAWYGEGLGLRRVAVTGEAVTFATGNVPLVIERERATVPARRDGYLVVFYTADIVANRDDLARRGVAGLSRVGSSDIGDTCRFTDPGGSTFCLYQPSAGCLTWGSGAKVKEIAGMRG